MAKVAAIQMVSGLDIKKNLENMSQLVSLAAEKGARLILLPEFFALLSNEHDQQIKNSEEPFKLNDVSFKTTNSTPIQTALSEVAKKNNIWVVGGTVPLKSENQNKIYNSMLTFNHKGTLVARYDKVHLFRYKSKNEVYDETKFILAGNNKKQITTPVGNTFFSICYDIRFPEFYRKKVQDSPLTDLILVSAAFTYATGMAHWELLLRARAVENQCFVLASAQGGKHECGRETWGHSMLISPWGDIIKQAKFGSDVVIGNVDQISTNKIRNKLPAIFHQRYDL